MNLNYIYNRTKDISINPEIEWNKITTEINNLILIPYSLLLAIGAIIGSIVFNINNLGSGINLSTLIIGINAFLLCYLGTYISAFVFNELLKNFSEEKNFKRSLSIITNTLIPYYYFVFLAYIIPQLNVLFSVLGIYSAYIFWVGIQNLIQIKTEKKIGFLILSTMIGMIIFFVLKYILGSIYLFIMSIF
jgi:Yip1-like protein